MIINNIQNRLQLSRKDKLKSNYQQYKANNKIIIFKKDLTNKKLNGNHKFCYKIKLI